MHLGKIIYATSVKEEKTMSLRESKEWFMGRVGERKGKWGKIM